MSVEKKKETGKPCKKTLAKLKAKELTKEKKHAKNATKRASKKVEKAKKDATKAKIVATKAAAKPTDKKLAAKAKKTEKKAKKENKKAKKAEHKATKKVEKADKKIAKAAAVKEVTTKKVAAAPAEALAKAKEDSDLVHKFLDLAANEKGAPKSIIAVAKKEQTALNTGIVTAKNAGKQ